MSKTYFLSVPIILTFLILAESMHTFQVSRPGMQNKEIAIAKGTESKTF